MAFPLMQKLEEAKQNFYTPVLCFCVKYTRPLCQVTAFSTFALTGSQSHLCPFRTKDGLEAVHKQRVKVFTAGCTSILGFHIRFFSQCKIN